MTPMKRFPAFRIHADEADTRAGIELVDLEQLSDGDVIIRVHYSSVNYKDALAGTGKARILRRSPLVGGIDLAGEVVMSSSNRFAPGDTVLVNGSGLSEVHDGGYAGYARVPADWIVPLPAKLNLDEAMIIGTAGFTAALCIHMMQQNHQLPEAGPVLVTGASGGVGSFAVHLLARLGYEVVAATGTPGADGYLRKLGAQEVIARDEVEIGRDLLGKARWAGAIDNVGGKTLSSVVRSTRPWGNVASVGIAGGSSFQLSTMPFIIRGVNLLGVSSSNCPQSLRRHIWERLGEDLRPGQIRSIHAQTVYLEDLPDVFTRLLNNEIRGRVLVKVLDS